MNQMSIYRKKYEVTLAINFFLFKKKKSSSIFYEECTDSESNLEFSGQRKFTGFDIKSTRAVVSSYPKQ